MCKAMTLNHLTGALFKHIVFPRIGKLRLSDGKTLDRGMSPVSQDLNPVRTLQPKLLHAFQGCREAEVSHVVESITGTGSTLWVALGHFPPRGTTLAGLCSSSH